VFHFMAEKRYEWLDLLKLMERLRGMDGCPWDIEQTHQSLKKYLLEETYEVMDAIDRKDPMHLQEELGDLLLQVVFHAQIAKEAGTFQIEDIIHGISEKMVFRHEHVFGENKCKTANEVVEIWEQRKKKEKGNTNHHEVLSQIPQNLPALIRSYKVQQKAALVGFDWDRISDVWNKVHEEMQELKQAIDLQQIDHTTEEIGDLFFALVNLSRFLDIHPEFALTKTTEKFIRRFGRMEQEALQSGRNLEDMTLSQMDELWEQAKKFERGDRSESG
jgi:tetrapyrrole methylase family protein / MazG family protein